MPSQKGGSTVHFFIIKVCRTLSLLLHLQFQHTIICTLPKEDKNLHLICTISEFHIMEKTRTLYNWFTYYSCILSNYCIIFMHPWFTLKIDSVSQSAHPNQPFSKTFDLPLNTFCLHEVCAWGISHIRVDLGTCRHDSGMCSGKSYTLYVYNAFHFFYWKGSSQNGMKSVIRDSSIQPTVTK